MIDIEVRNNIEQTAQRFAQQGLDIKSTFTPELVKSLAESSRPQAEKNVARNLALKALADSEGIEISNQEIEEKIKEYSEEIEKSPKSIDINKLKEAIKNDLLKTKLIEWLEKNSEIKEINKNSKKTDKSIQPKANLKDKKIKSQSKKERANSKEKK